MNLIQALELKPRETISLVGGGGKTTIMFALARELQAAGHKVITTTTTKIFEPSAEDTPRMILLGESQRSKVKGQNYSLKVKTEVGLNCDDLDWLKSELEIHGHITLAQERISENKLKGIRPEMILELDSLRLAPYIIVEADGSKQHPLKASNATEPVIPENTTLVIAVLGIEALNRPLNEESVFRAEIASRLLGLALESPMTSEAIATLVSHPQGMAKGSPDGARIIPFINKMDLNSDLAEARDLARKILEVGKPRIEKVILGEAKSESNPVLEVVEGLRREF